MDGELDLNHTSAFARVIKIISRCTRNGSSNRNSVMHLTAASRWNFVLRRDMSGSVIPPDGDVVKEHEERSKKFANRGTARLPAGLARRDREFCRILHEADIVGLIAKVRKPWTRKWCDLFNHLARQRLVTGRVLLSLP
jgi:hypothetical protein